MHDRPAQASPAMDRPVWPQGVSILFGIGAQKAGTSWLYHYLGQHPACRPGPIKELRYFDTVSGVGRVNRVKRRSQWKRLDLTDIVEREAWLQGVEKIHAVCTAPDPNHQSYVDLLTDGLQPGQVALDITPNYARLSAETFRQMAELGDTRFLFLLREPVSRLWSAVRFKIANEVEDPAEFETACRSWLDFMLGSDKPRQFAWSDYAATLERLDTAVPAERKLVLFYEDLFSPETAMRICDFLGIERRSPDDARVVNKGLSAQMRGDQMEPLLARLRPQYEAVCARFGAAVPQAWHRRFAPEMVAG